ncbi:MAG: hypothetical protein NTV51_24540 [Verrucomicrobia bacterium]|nr:hypothetical protein [Verrucomicrobiota bacterium]
MSARDADKRGRYTLLYQLPNPCVRRENVPVLKMRVTGKNAMETTRRTLRQSGYTIVRVVRTNWFT